MTMMTKQCHGHYSARSTFHGAAIGRSTILWAILAVAVTIPMSVAVASGSRFISIDPYGLHVGNSTRDIGYNQAVGAQGAVVMPDPSVSGRSLFSFSFNVPEDYAAGTSIVLQVTWRSDAVSCIVDLRNNALYRSRPGVPTDAGVLFRQTVMQAPATPLSVARTTFSLNDLDLYRDDVVQGVLVRSQADDTCTDDLHVLGLFLEYEATTSSLFADGFEP